MAPAQVAVGKCKTLAYSITMTLRPFHLAFPVNDLAAAREFYGDAMGCREGRSSDE